MRAVPIFYRRYREAQIRGIKEERISARVLEHRDVDIPRVTSD